MAAPELYGAMKVSCEQAVLEANESYSGERTPQSEQVFVQLRPGIVAGPHEPTKRFSWGVARGAGATDAAESPT